MFSIFLIPLQLNCVEKSKGKVKINYLVDSVRIRWSRPSHPHTLLIKCLPDPAKHPCLDLGLDHSSFLLIYKCLEAIVTYYPKVLARILKQNYMKKKCNSTQIYSFSLKTDLKPSKCICGQNSKRKWRCCTYYHWSASQNAGINDLQDKNY